MSVPFVALFAAALHQVNAAAADPEVMDETITLLARAASGRAVAIEVVAGTLYVNDIPLPADAPGASRVIAAFASHGTGRLGLPASLDPRKWREVIEVLGSVAALYPTADDIRDALRASVPAAAVGGPSSESGFTDLREAMFELPGLITDAGAGSGPATEGLTTSSTDRAELSTRLDPILKAAAAAVSSRDYERVAELILELAEISEDSDEATRSIIARERRRMAPQGVVESMVRMIPRSDTSPTISRAVMKLGRDGVEALIDALSGAPSHVERRAYMEALTVVKDADESIVAALGSARAELVRDAADVAGRRRMDAAVPSLGHLLKHDDERVRTAAWQALERIGTPQALDTLYGQPSAGRSPSRG